MYLMHFYFIGIVWYRNLAKKRKKEKKKKKTIVRYATLVKSA